MKNDCICNKTKYIEISNRKLNTCDICGREIREEEYKNNNRLCKECLAELQ